MQPEEARRHAVVKRLAVDIARVVEVYIKEDERLACLAGALLEKTVEQLFPGRGMRTRRPGSV